MFYIIKNLLINTKEVKYVKLYDNAIQPPNRFKKENAIKIVFKDDKFTKVVFETEEEAKEELFKMYLKLNKPF